MAGKSTRDIMVEDLAHNEETMGKVAATRGSIWQDECIYWIAKAIRDLLLYVIGDIERKRIKEEHRD